jgi:hypothetical protein
MGLDMYAWRVKAEDAIDDFSVASGDDGSNKVEVRLTMEDLQRLAVDVTKGRLPETTGFFFGDNPPDPDSVAQDMEFIGKAMAVVAVGDAVYYDSWW